MRRSTDARKLEDKLGIKIVISDALPNFEAILTSREEFDKAVDKAIAEAADQLRRSNLPMPFCPERAPGE